MNSMKQADRAAPASRQLALLLVLAAGLALELKIKPTSCDTLSPTEGRGRELGRRLAPTERLFEGKSIPGFPRRRFGAPISAL